MKAAVSFSDGVVLHKASSITACREPLVRPESATRGMG